MMQSGLFSLAVGLWADGLHRRLPKWADSTSAINLPGGWIQPSVSTSLQAPCSSSQFSAGVSTAILLDDMDSARASDMLPSKLFRIQNHAYM